MAAPVKLPGWQGEFGVDFSDYPIGGTNCRNCRSLVDGFPTPRCKSQAFIDQAILAQGKKKGDDVIPVRSGDAADYCCNAWALSEEER